MQTIGIPIVIMAALLNSQESKELLHLAGRPIAVCLKQLPEGNKVSIELLIQIHDLSGSAAEIVGVQATFAISDFQYWYSELPSERQFVIENNQVEPLFLKEFEVVPEGPNSNTTLLMPLWIPVPDAATVDIPFGRKIKLFRLVPSLRSIY
jgi:hypothetical protein